MLEYCRLLWWHFSSDLARFYQCSKISVWLVNWLSWRSLRNQSRVLRPSNGLHVLPDGEGWIRSTPSLFKLAIQKKLRDLHKLYISSSPRIWHASLFVKPRRRYQSFRANSKISWHTLPSLRRKTAAATTSSWPDYHIQDILRSFDVDPNLFFSPPNSMWPKWAPIQGAPRCKPPPMERVGIFGEGCEILGYAACSFCLYFQEKFG